MDDVAIFGLKVVAPSIQKIPNKKENQPSYLT